MLDTLKKYIVQKVNLGKKINVIDNSTYIIEKLEFKVRKSSFSYRMEYLTMYSEKLVSLTETEHIQLHNFIINVINNKELFYLYKSINQ